MKDKFLKFYQDEIIGKKGRHNYVNIPLDFLRDNDIYLHFTDKKNLKSILLDDDAKGIIHSKCLKNNIREAGYYTKDARSYNYGNLCLVVDLSGLLSESQKGCCWGIDEGQIGLPNIWLKKTVPVERIIGYWIYDDNCSCNDENVNFNNKYNNLIRFN